MSKKKVVTIQVDEKLIETLKAASKSLSELASSAIVAAEETPRKRR